MTSEDAEHSDQDVRDRRRERKAATAAPAAARRQSRRRERSRSSRPRPARARSSRSDSRADNRGSRRRPFSPPGRRQPPQPPRPPRHGHRGDERWTSSEHESDESWNQYSHRKQWELQGWEWRGNPNRYRREPRAPAARREEYYPPLPEPVRWEGLQCSVCGARIKGTGHRNGDEKALESHMNNSSKCLQMQGRLRKHTEPCPWGCGKQLAAQDWWAHQQHWYHCKARRWR